MEREKGGEDERGRQRDGQQRDWHKVKKGEETEKMREMVEGERKVP